MQRILWEIFKAKKKNDIYHHVGIYCYELQTLKKFVSFKQSKNELENRLEQLRALQNGIRIHVDISRDKIPAGIDTEKDLELVRKSLSSTNNAPQ